MPSPFENADAVDTDASAATATLRQDGLVAARTADVGRARERSRQKRLRRVGLLLLPIAALLVVRDLVWHHGQFALPHLPGSLGPYAPALVLVALLGSVMVIPLLAAGRSPHVLYRPGEIDVSFDDVRGAGVVVEEVQKTLNLFLAHKTFSTTMGGSARRGILFEGPPGTGKTYLARAMAAEAGVPFLFVSSSAFQSMFYGQTNRKIRSYFKALRKYARREGGAIGFIEEIDAIGASRSHSGFGHREGVAGVVNELLIQLQSFDTPPAGTRFAGVLVDAVNFWLPSGRHLKQAGGAPGQPARDRRHQPGGRPRPRPPAAGPVRPLHLLRPPHPGRAAGDHRLLPRQEGARPGAGRPRPARHAGLDHGRLFAGHDRAPLGRGAHLGTAARRRPPVVGRPHAGQDDERGRAGAGHRLHGGRAPHDRHARGGARHGGLAGRQGSQARAALDREAPGRARHAHPLGDRGALHEDQERARRR